MQTLPDWQVRVDASANTSSRLSMDKTPGISLREFLEALDIADDAVLGTIRIRGVDSDLTPGTPVDLGAVVTSVTVDGEGGAPADESDGSLEITLDAVREVAIVDPTEDGAATLVDRDTPGTGKKLNISFPTALGAGAMELVFSHRQHWPSSGPSIAAGPSTATALAFSSLVGANVSSAFSGAYSTSTGKFTVPVGEAGQYLFFVQAVIGLGSVSDTAPTNNWQLDIRDNATNTIFAHTSNTTFKASTGLGVLHCRDIAEGDGLYPAFLPSWTGTDMELSRLELVVFKIGDVAS
jgi:hypothetical protein